jgi:hypothetical protein
LPIKPAHGFIKIEEHAQSHDGFNEGYHAPIQFVIDQTEAEHEQHGYKNKNVKMETEYTVAHIIIFFTPPVQQFKP